MNLIFIMKKPVLIYTEKFSTRLSYTVEVLLGSLLGLPYQITTDKKYFKDSVEPRINYSKVNIEDVLQIIPSGLISETGTRVVDPAYFKWNNHHVLFYSRIKADIPFDIFSAAFYMLTRYEEYLPFKPDDHGRFSSDLSVAGKHGFLEEPVVQQWAFILLKALQEKSTDLVPRRQRFTLETTIDVDVAYAYLFRNLSRFALASIRDFTSFKWKRLLDRLMVTIKSKHDPFDTFNYISLVHKKYDLPVYMFYLAGEYGHYDRNVPFEEPSIQKLIPSLNDKFFIGLHPSYKASENFDVLKLEYEKMSESCNRPMSRSRQHFLRLSFPKTYQWLIQLGITTDFSMGYHDKPGFRAGIAAPYTFYDLSTEAKTGLTIHPFVFMERTLKDRLKLNPDLALLKIQDLMKKVNAVNGTFGTLWHNDSLSDYGEWKRWRYVYEVMLSMGYTMNRKREIQKKVVQLEK
jgi:hypothetical protein